MGFSWGRSRGAHGAHTTSAKVLTSANRGGNFCHRAPPIDCFWNFLISLFKGLGQAPLGSGLGSPQVCQEHSGWSYLSADTINLEICPAVSSVIPKLSIWAFHKYYIKKFFTIWDAPQCLRTLWMDPYGLDQSEGTFRAPSDFTWYCFALWALCSPVQLENNIVVVHISSTSRHVHPRV